MSPAKPESPAMNKLIEKHPLQRLNAPGIGISAFVHALGVASFTQSFKFLVDHPTPMTDAYGWHFSYLTILGLSFATISFIFGSLADLTNSSRLFLLKNLFSIVATPLEVVVSILYWGLSLIDPALVKPGFLVIDPFNDFLFHAAPAILLTVDLLFLSPPWTITALPTIATGSVLAIIYWFWVELCYSKNGFYPYPIFDLATREQRMGLFAMSAGIFATSALSLKWLYGRVNGYGTDQPPKATPRNIKA